MSSRWGFVKMVGRKILYERLDILSRRAGVLKTVPQSIARNLSPCYELRPQ